MVDELLPPRKSVELEDRGAHPPDIPSQDSSDDSDAFMDASERQTGPRLGNESPIPRTRVEKVDDIPAHGEVPGTAAYKLRTKDAVPDEMEVVPDGQRSRSGSIVRPSTPGGTLIPKIIAEKIDPDAPSYGDVPGTAAYEMRKADARPDEIVRSPVTGTPPQRPWDGLPTASRSKAGHEARIGEPLGRDAGGGEDEDEDEDEEEDDGGFGDDFDDFEEGQEAEDFGDFGGEDILQAATPGQPPTTPQYPSIPTLDFTPLTSADSISSAASPYLRTLFPASPSPTDEAPSLTLPNPKVFTSDRSHSLYTQLIAPPPLAPPNWLRSRIRRLFLVSLGVPVDLDAILPASKQKKLVLPSVEGGSGRRSASVGRESSPAPPRSAAGRARLNDDPANDSAASADAKGAPPKARPRRAHDPLPPPDFDALEAVRVAATTAEKLRGLSGRELTEHVRGVEVRIERGREVLEYWERRKREAEMEKEAFEGVVGRLVEYARKVRK